MPMDICSHIGLSVTDDVNKLHGLCMNTLESTHGVLKVVSVDELGNGVTEFLNIKEDEDSSSSPPCENSDSEKKDHCNQNEKCASKELADDENVKSRSISLSNHAKKPVSALKGSREKLGGGSAVKLRVKWAPDVYDPIPTSVSHVVTNNRPSRHGKKSSKNKQKKSSRGSKGKDKKQVRKRGGSSSSSSSSSMGYKLEEDFEPMPDFHPDQFCGSSFLKRHGTSLHLSSVAEAT